MMRHDANIETMCMNKVDKSIATDKPISRHVETVKVQCKGGLMLTEKYCYYVKV